MRQVFTSHRLENVEQVARALEEAGIEVRISNGRSYRGSLRGNFSYRDQGETQKPAVWIIRSEDQPRARAMLREAGLMDSTRYAPDSLLAASFRETDPYAATPSQKRAFRMKIVLLFGIGAVLVMALMHGSGSKPPIAKATPIPVSPAPNANVIAVETPAPREGSADAGELREVAPANAVVKTPADLAAVVFASAIDATKAQIVCLALDGADAPVQYIAQLKKLGALAVVASDCTIPPSSEMRGTHRASGQPAFFLEVGAFRPDRDHSDTGTIQRSVYATGRAPAHDTLTVTRERGTWRISAASTP